MIICTRSKAFRRTAGGSAVDEARTGFFFARRPSRLKVAAGMRPARRSFLVVHGRREEIDIPAFAFRGGGAENAWSPVGHQDSVGLAGNAARFERSFATHHLELLVICQTLVLRSFSSLLRFLGGRDRFENIFSIFRDSDHGMSLWLVCEVTRCPGTGLTGERRRNFLAPDGL